MAKKTYRIPTGCQEQLWALRIQQVSETKPLLSWEEAEKQICVSGNCKCQEGDIHKEIESEGLLSGWGVWLFYTGVREGFLKKWQLTRGGDWGGGIMKSSRQQKPQVQRPFVSEMYCLYSKEQHSGQFGWNGRSEGKVSGDEDGELARAYSEVKWSRSVMSDSLDPMDCSPPGSSVHGIFQARVLEWVAISFSRGSSRPRDQTWVSRIVDHLRHQGNQGLQ